MVDAGNTDDHNKQWKTCVWYDSEFDTNNYMPVDTPFKFFLEGKYIALFGIVEH